MDLIDTIKLFDEKVAQCQRGAPEHAMLKVQYAMGGGVLNGVVEHVGDLTHRMSERITADSRGYEYVKEKVEKTLRWLTNAYGFEREMNENIIHNAEYHNTDEHVYRRKIEDALRIYADEHRKIPAYNEAQFTARDAAIALGEKDFPRAIRDLKKLKVWLDHGEIYWMSKASQLEWPTGR